MEHSPFSQQGTRTPFDSYLIILSGSIENVNRKRLLPSFRRMNCICFVTIFHFLVTKGGIRLRRSGGFAPWDPHFVCGGAVCGGAAPSRVLHKFASSINPCQRWVRAHLWTPHAKAAPLTAFSIKEWQSFPPWLASFGRWFCTLLITRGLAHVALCILILEDAVQAPLGGSGGGLSESGRIGLTPSLLIVPALSPLA